MSGEEDEDRSLTQLLDRMDHAARGERMSISDMLDEFGERAITPFILIVALLLVSPLSGIPGTPTVGAIVIVTLTVQALFGRRRLWLPSRLTRLELPAARVRQAVGWMRRPCAFLDRHSRERLQFLTTGPMRLLTLLVCVIVPLGWPLLELLPFVTSVGAGTVSLLAFGLLTRDGVDVLAGYVLVVAAFTGGLVIFT